MPSIGVGEPLPYLPDRRRCGGSGRDIENDVAVVLFCFGGVCVMRDLLPRPEEAGQTAVAAEIEARASAFIASMTVRVTSI